MFVSFKSRTPECENVVRQLIHLQAITNNMPDAFNETARVTKSHIPVANALARIEVPEKPTGMDQNISRLKRGRPLRSKDIVPRKRRGRNLESAPEEHTNLSRGTTIQREHQIALEVAQTHEHIAPEETHERITNPGNTEIPINYYNEIGVEMKQSSMIFLLSQLLMRL